MTFVFPLYPTTSRPWLSSCVLLKSGKFISQVRLSQFEKVPTDSLRRHVTYYTCWYRCPSHYNGDRSRFVHCTSKKCSVGKDWSSASVSGCGERVRLHVEELGEIPSFKMEMIPAGKQFELTSAMTSWEVHAAIHEPLKNPMDVVHSVVESWIQMLTSYGRLMTHC
jgi:hypothetical protein